MKKQFIFFLGLIFMVASSFSTSSIPAPKIVEKTTPTEQALSAELINMTVDQLLNLTPSEYKKITGHRLGLKNTIALKVAQKKMKKEMKRAEVRASKGDGPSPGIDKTVYVLLAVFFIPFVAVGLATDWEGKDWIHALLWTLLCGLPGVIYALVKMKKYYN